ncbi:MAG: hypothetical protein IJT02_08130 [Synergistaceae bacterium]|nr:hypothetical protein [Synergistaceae bacterium]
MSGFTKGIWKYSEELQEVTAYPEGSGDWPIVGGLPRFPGDGNSLWKDITGELCWNGTETDANGRLIAAAPEMYRLLCEFLKIDEQKTWAATEKNDPAYMMALMAQDGAVNMAKKLLARIDNEGAEA